MEYDKNGYLVYQDPNSKGWILKIEAIDGWYLFGVFGTYEAAMEHVR